jgi:hypothetical protein
MRLAVEAKTSLALGLVGRMDLRITSVIIYRHPVLRHTSASMN